MPLTPDLADMGAHEFVSLTTFRRNGTPVATPVWIARDGDALVVTTLADAGKVKRLRRDPRVELRPCSRRGAVPEGAPTVAGVGEVVSAEARYLDVLRAKYRWQYRLITLLERVLRRGRSERVIIRITASSADGATPG